MARIEPIPSYLYVALEKRWRTRLVFILKNLFPIVPMVFECLKLCPFVKSCNWKSIEDFVIPQDYTELHFFTNSLRLLSMTGSSQSRFTGRALRISFGNWKLVV